MGRCNHAEHEVLDVSRAQRTGQAKLSSRVDVIYRTPDTASSPRWVNMASGISGIADDSNVMMINDDGQCIHDSIDCS